MAQFVDLTAALVLFALLLGTIWRPPIAYAAVVASFAFEQWAQASGGFFAANSQIINFITGGIVGVGVLMSFANGKRPLRNTEGIYFGIIALFSYALLSGFWAVYPSGTWSVFWYTGPYLLVYVFALPLVFNEEKDFRIALIATLVLGLFVTIALVFGTTIHEWGRTVEVAVAIVDRYGREKDRLSPLAIASYASVLTLVSITSHLGRLSKFLKLAAWVVVPLSMFLVLRSESRGQFMAVILVGLLVVRMSFPGKNFGRTVQTAFIVALFLGLGYFMFDFFFEDAKSSRLARWSLSGLQRDFEGTRVIMCRNLLTAWIKSSPINLLLGLGSSASFSPNINGVYPHVQVVEILAELGFIGLGIAATIVWQVFSATVRLLNMTKKDLLRRGVLTAFVATSLLWVVLSFKQGSFLSSYAMYYDFAILGRMAVILRRTERARGIQNWQPTQGVRSLVSAR